MKHMASCCIVGALAFGFGSMSGAIIAGGTAADAVALVVACCVALWMAFKCALEDGQWLDAHQAPEATALEPEAGHSTEYELGYDQGFEDAVESLLYTRPPRERAEKSKKPRRGA